MGYLDNATITVDAILTKKGRELLAKGAGFNITQFALADDEVDYSLYTSAHPLGTDYYGASIENMPVLEASPDETQNMRFKLVSLPRGTKIIPIIQVGSDQITLTAGQGPFTITPSTSQNLNGAGFGYTAILANADAATLVGTGLADTVKTTTPTFLSDVESANAIVARGLVFTITPKDVAAQIETTLQVIGNQTGGSVTVPLIVNVKPSV
jgi:hypothetical protein